MSYRHIDSTVVADGKVPAGSHILDKGDSIGLSKLKYPFQKRRREIFTRNFFVWNSNTVAVSLSSGGVISIRSIEGHRDQLTSPIAG